MSVEFGKCHNRATCLILFEFLQPAYNTSHL
jgi:hypothetical protein